MKKQAIEVVFFKGSGFVSNSIMKLTDSEVSHVALLLDDGAGEPWYFETHIGKNAAYVPARKYKDSAVVAFEILPKKKEFFNIVKGLCDKYQFAPYSPWDIFTQGATSWLAPNIRKGLVKFLGGKKFMICSELAARILYEADQEQFAEFEDFEGLTPADLLMACRLHSHDFKAKS